MKLFRRSDPSPKAVATTIKTVPSSSSSSSNNSKVLATASNKNPLPRAPPLPSSHGKPASGGGPRRAASHKSWDVESVDESLYTSGLSSPQRSTHNNKQSSSSMSTTSSSASAAVRRNSRQPTMPVLREVDESRPNGSVKSESTQGSRPRPPLNNNNNNNTLSNPASVVRTSRPNAIQLKEGFRPTLSIEERQQQMGQPRYHQFQINDQNDREIPPPPPSSSRRPAPPLPLALPPPRGSNSSNRRRGLDGVGTSQASLGVYSTVSKALHDVWCEDDDIAIDSDDEEFDLSSSRVNISDTQLMEDDNSPGQLRLTEEGLKRHERKSIEKVVKEPLKSSEGYDAWKREQDKKLYVKAKLAERKKEEEELGIPPRQLPRVRDARSIMTRETRTSTTHNTNNNSLSDQTEEEKKRIERLKAAELERQRKLQAQVAEERKRLGQDTSASTSSVVTRDRRDVDLPAVVSLDEHDRNDGDYAFDCTQNDSGRHLSEESTITTSVSSLPCVICDSGDRTHIALPCMHYSFCDDCVQRLEEKTCAECPVCHKSNITFSRVFA